MIDIKKMNMQEINKELVFLNGYLSYLEYENPLFKEYQKNFELLQNERKKRNLEKYQKQKNQYVGY